MYGLASSATPGLNPGSATFLPEALLKFIFWLKKNYRKQYSSSSQSLSKLIQFCDCNFLNISYLTGLFSSATIHSDPLTLSWSIIPTTLHVAPLFYSFNRRMKINIRKINHQLIKKISFCLEIPAKAQDVTQPMRVMLEMHVRTCTKSQQGMAIK